MSDYEKIYCFSKSEYKALIESSTLFSLDPEREANAYRREKYKMVDYLAKYLFAINEEEYTQYGEAIWKLSERCIKYYDASTGVPFLAYFMKAWEKEYNRQIFASAQDGKLSGVHIKFDEKKTINSYIYRAKREGIDYQTREFAARVASIINWDIEEVLRIIQQMERGSQSLYVKNDDGEEVNVLDISKNDNEEDPVFSEVQCNIDLRSDIGSCIPSLDRIDRIFNGLQERQKPLLKRLVSLELSDTLLADKYLLEKAAKCSFFDAEVIQAVISGKEVSQKTLAEELGYSEQHASRSIGTFMKKLKERE